MKRGLDHPTLAKMKRSLARDQTLTQQVLRTLQRTSLHELVCVDDEEIADEVGMIKKVPGLRAHAKERHVTEV